ncbi:MAG: hypothetical protein LUG12_12835 [Erysipelotrichaceae bacterium]|nr:hypothetical protein [Erysipelotrichaceae bacterium]
MLDELVNLDIIITSEDLENDLGDPDDTIFYSYKEMLDYVKSAKSTE